MTDEQGKPFSYYELPLSTKGQLLISLALTLSFNSFKRTSFRILIFLFIFLFAFDAVQPDCSHSDELFLFSFF